MPYSPQIQYRGGEYLAQGISQCVAAMAEGGIIVGAERRRQKTEWENAAETLQPLIEQIVPGAGLELRPEAKEGPQHGHN